MSHSLKIDSTKQGIHAVTVFQSDRAEIRRNIKVELKAGQNEVNIENLPVCLDEDSIRVDGYGNAVIFDVVYHPGSPPDPKSEIAGKLVILQEKRDALSSDKSLFEEQVNMLQQYGKTLTGKDTNLMQFSDFLNVFEKKRKELYASIKEKEEELEAVDKVIQELQAEMYQDVDGLKRGVQVTVVVLAEADGPAEITLAYVVSGASWTALYDLRAKISTEAKVPSPVSLHYRASISQNTGEDWNNVELTLSTASPLLASTIPTLQYWRIREAWRPSLKAVRYLMDTSTSAIAEEEDGVHRKEKKEKEKDQVTLGGFGRGGAPPPPMLRQTAAVASESAINAAFAIEGLSSIPSDTSTNTQAHKVSIAAIELKADLEWVSVPKEISAAFLQCQVKNTSQYVLLPGQSNVFMDNNFVAKSTIPNVSPQESFSCSLGVDPAIRVTYHPVQKKTKSSSGGLTLSAKADTTTFIQSITLRNTRLTPVPRLILKDQVPVSEDARFKVNVLDPRELVTLLGTLSKNSNISTGESIAIAGFKGVRVRWAQKNEDGSGGDAGNGVVEWICDVRASSRLDLTLSWEVSAAGGVKWS